MPAREATNALSTGQESPGRGQRTSLRTPQESSQRAAGRVGRDIPARSYAHSCPLGRTFAPWRGGAGIEAISSLSGYQTEAFASPGASFATTLTSAQFTLLLDGTSRSVCAGSWCPMAEHSSGGGFSDVSFLTVAEVAAAMRVSKMTVYRLVHAGELPAVRVGRSFRVSEDAVDEYLRRSFFQAG
jgi:excisionase family DNA binding protein